MLPRWRDPGERNRDLRERDVGHGITRFEKYIPNGFFARKAE